MTKHEIIIQTYTDGYSRVTFKRNGVTLKQDYIPKDKEKATTQTDGLYLLIDKGIIK